MKEKNLVVVLTNQTANMVYIQNKPFHWTHIRWTVMILTNKNMIKNYQKRTLLLSQPMNAVELWVIPDTEDTAL